LNWIHDVRRELQLRIYEGCGRYTRWSSVVDGSLKTLKEEHRSKRRLFISISEQQNFAPLLETDQWSNPTFATDQVSNWGGPTIIEEDYSPQSQNYPKFDEDIVSFSGPTNYGLPTGFDNHPQFDTTSSFPFTTGNGLASNSGYTLGADHMAQPMQSWTPSSNPGTDQEFMHAHPFSPDTFHTRQQFNTTLLQDPISDNPLLHESTFVGNYPAHVELDD
jgi:hypothetical protein